MSVSKEMRVSINQRIKELEREKEIKILYACESGSRAWGFPSQDSDYDVRFIYRYAANRYWSVFAVPEVVDVAITDELDLAGWDLRKTLGLLYKSNAALMEWLQSPVVYYKDDSFLEQIRGLMPECFQVKAAAHHYHGIAQNGWKVLKVQSEVRYKKYFYVLRSLLALEYTLRFQSLPPMTWQELAHVAAPNDEFRQLCSQLIDEKSAETEASLTKRYQVLDDFIVDLLENGKERAAAFTTKETNRNTIDHFFRSTLQDS